MDNVKTTDVVPVNDVFALFKCKTTRPAVPVTGRVTFAVTTHPSEPPCHKTEGCNDPECPMITFAPGDTVAVYNSKKG